jgi:phosphatidylethanolamine-binding protein (PEBP) family uncharacterized protein
MAQKRSALGGLVAFAIAAVIAVAGCGGEDSSATSPAMAGASVKAVDQPGWRGEAPKRQPRHSAKPGSTSDEPTREAHPAKRHQDEDSASSPETPIPSTSSEKKHPPLVLPGGPPESGPTNAQRAAVPTANIQVMLNGGSLKTANTCGGSNVSPGLEWSAVPSGTVELALFVMNLEPVDGTLYFDWAVAGIDPATESLQPGKLPRGAVVGSNSAGQEKYSLCPAGTGTENYVFAVYALPRSLSPKQGFEPLGLRAEAMHLSESVGLLVTPYHR